MKKLMRRLSLVADSSHYSLLRSESRLSRRSHSLRTRLSGGVPEGHLPVYVGDEMERFVVSAQLLNHPVFINLLNKSAQEYGYQQQGSPVTCSSSNASLKPCDLAKKPHTTRFSSSSLTNSSASVNLP